MAKPTQDHLATAVAAFNQNVATLRRLRGLENDSELWRLMNKKVDGAPARKTVNNALQDRHDARLSTYEALAETLDCPLWVLFIPGMKESDLQSPNRERLIAHVQTYLRCNSDERMHVESMAAAFAAKPK